MLKRIVGENYQSHQFTEVKFSPKVTAIIGSSDAGKSSIIRMIRWVLFNRPLGSSIIRRGSKGGCSVTIENEGGVLVEKKRDSGGTLYTVDSEEFDKVSTNVPAQVTEQLNLDEINFQNQLEPHFLVLQPPGQIAAYINKVLKMDILSTAVQIASSQIRKVEGNITELKQARDYAKSKIEVYKDLDTIELQIDKHSFLQEELESTLEDEKELLATLNAIQALDEQIAGYGNVDKYSATIVTLDQVIGDIDTMDLQIEELDGCIRQILELEEEIEIYQSDCKYFEGKLDSLYQDYEEFLHQMGNCPWCGQEMSDDAIEYKKEGLG